MHIDTLKLPVNWQKVRIHRQANRIGRRLVDQQKLPQDLSKYGEVCQQCGRRETHCPKFRLCQPSDSIRDRYGLYGPNCVIYLGLIKRIAIFMFVCMILYCVPLFVLNLVGVVCAKYSNACTSQDVIYYWSTYNVLGQNPGSLPHHILWLVFSVSMCLFTLYLRKYSLKTYRIINNRNTTDSDYCIILRRLPIDVTQQDIKDLFEKQVIIEYDQQPNKNSKVYQQMKTIKVRNILIIEKFYELMETNDKNVKKFKDFTKKKKKKEEKKKVRRHEIQVRRRAGQNVPSDKSSEDPSQMYFVAQPLPEITQLANAAIVRFSNNRQKDLILRTVKTSFGAKLIAYFFPFYNPLSQYRINNKKISIAKAPQPSDLQWQNFGFHQSIRIIKKVVSSIFTALLLILSAGISIAISIWIQSLLSNSGIQPVFLTILLIFITLLINIIIQIVIQICIRWIRLDTFTDQMCEQLSVSVINQSINLGFFSIFAPIIAKLPSFIKLNTSDSSTFPVLMFTTIIIQSFLGTTINFLLNYFQIYRKLMKFLDDKGMVVNTQTEGYTNFKGPQIPFVFAYSHIVKIVWFSFLYAVVSPICVFIGTIGFTLFYFYQKALFNSKYSIPVYGNSRINSTLIDLLDFTPFLIGLFNLFLYNTTQSSRQFETDGRIYGVVLTNIIIGAIHALMPWKNIISNFYNQKQSNSIQEFNRSSLQETYQKSYPAFNPEFILATQNLIQSRANLIPDEQIVRTQVNIQQYIKSVYSNQNILEKWCCK